jgi:Asp-tRNA(Asn)/Glu-tRNA(Gln) amidotransferase A subunit family amidase
VTPQAGRLADIAASVRSRATTAVDVVTDCLERAAHSQDRLNAFTVIDTEGALARAAAIDASVADGGDPGPLSGAPIAVKDLIDQAGMPTTNGADFPVEPAPSTATAVRRLEDAGAVVIGRTGLHEFAFGFSSENPWFGPVRNPWDPSLSPGGSSGGSGAAVGGGIVAGALGTDTGGSVRVPAALCGAVGLKVTHGRISLAGVTPLAPSFDTVGPIAASLADAAALYTTMAGIDVADMWSLDAVIDRVAPPPEPSEVRIGVPHPWVDRPLADEVAEAWDGFLTMAAEAGFRFVDLELPDVEFPGLTTEAMYPEVAAVHRDRFTADPGRYGEEVRDRVAAAMEATMAGYLAGTAWRRRIRHAADQALRSCDALVTPAVAAMRKTIGVSTVEIGGDTVGYRMALSCFSSPVNSMGLPALTVPIACDGAPPPSIQLIGSAWSEAQLLAIGGALEQAAVVAVPEFRGG